MHSFNNWRFYIFFKEMKPFLKKRCLKINLKQFAIFIIYNLDYKKTKCLFFKIQQPYERKFDS